jgi:hypothetical protein
MIMRLLTKELERKLPPLYATEDIKAGDKIALVKFFTPWTNWTWYGVEYDPAERRFFGLVVGHKKELGYWTLDEMESVRHRSGLKIERDRHFRPAKLRDLVYGHVLEGHKPCTCR